MIFPNPKTQQEYIQTKVKEWIDILKLNDYKSIIEFKDNMDELASTNTSLIKKHVGCFNIVFLKDYYEPWSEGEQDRFYNWKEFLEEIVIHELLHIKIAKLLAAYERYIPDHILESTPELLENIEEEFFVDSMSRILQELRKKK